jgi:ribosome-binding protein aMBF1 (putative translation factor)
MDGVIPMKTTRDFGKYLQRKIAQDPELAAAVEREHVNALVAMEIYEVRTAEGLTQAQLAELIGTQQSVIARLEDADYRGHSLQMLQKVAAATGRRLEVRMLPTGEKPSSAKRAKRSKVATR